MIKPIARGGDYLEFKCDECGDIIHHVIRISHDAPTYTDEQKYDVRNWTIMMIHLQCPKCGSEDEYKLSLREDTAKKQLKTFDAVTIPLAADNIYRLRSACFSSLSANLIFFDAEGILSLVRAKRAEDLELTMINNIPIWNRFALPDIALRAIKHTLLSL